MPVKKRVRSVVLPSKDVNLTPENANCARIRFLRFPAFCNSVGFIKNNSNYIYTGKPGLFVHVMQDTMHVYMELVQVKLINGLYTKEFKTRSSRVASRQNGVSELNKFIRMYSSEKEKKTRQTLTIFEQPVFRKIKSRRVVSTNEKNIVDLDGRKFHVVQSSSTFYRFFPVSKNDKLLNLDYGRNIKLGKNNFVLLRFEPDRRKNIYSVSLTPLVKEYFVVEGRKIYYYENKDHGDVVNLKSMVNDETISFLTSLFKKYPIRCTLYGIGYIITSMDYNDNSKCLDLRLVKKT